MFTSVYLSDSVAIRRGLIDWTKPYKSNLILSAYRSDVNNWEIVEYQFEDTQDIRVKSGTTIKENVTDFELVHFLAAIDPEDTQITFYSSDDPDDRFKEITTYTSAELIRFRDRLELIRT